MPSNSLPPGPTWSLNKQVVSIILPPGATYSGPSVRPAPDTTPLAGNASCAHCASTRDTLERALSLLSRMATGYDYTADEIDAVEAELAEVIERLATLSQ